MGAWACSTICACLTIALGAMTIERAPAAEPTEPAAKAAADRNRGLRRHIYCVQPDGSQPMGPGGGKGIVVIDMDDQFRFVKRIATPALEKLRHSPISGTGARGIAACGRTKRLFYSWHQSGKTPVADGAGCIDLLTEKVLWEKYYDFTCDRLGLSPDGKTLLVPVHWSDRLSPDGRQVLVPRDVNTPCVMQINPDNGEVVRRFELPAAQHMVAFSPDGKRVVAGKEPGALGFELETGKLLWTNDISFHITLTRDAAHYYTGRHKEQKTVGTWIIDTATGQPVAKAMLDDQKFPGLSGGISEVVAFEPGEKRFWGQAGDKMDAWMLRFDNTVMPPKLIQAVSVKSIHGYESLGHSHGHALVSGAGDLVFFSNGVALKADSGAFVARWSAENGQLFHSAKYLEIDFLDGKLLWAGQDVGHGYIYDSYPIDKVRPLLGKRAAAGNPDLEGKPQ